METTTIDILRHGRTTADDIFRGQVDTPLAEEGFQQMQASLAPYRDPSPWQLVVSSPLQRCLYFAETLGKEINSEVFSQRGFIEMDYGDWDGRPFKEVRAEDPELFNNVWQKPHDYAPPNGETFHEFYERVDNAWQQLIKDHQGKHILLICHGGVIRALLGKLMQSPLTALSRIDVPYASLSQIKIYHQAGRADWPQLSFHRPHPQPYPSP
jgi:broad specificity phosphatase PhoE